MKSKARIIVGLVMLCLFIPHLSFAAGESQIDASLKPSIIEPPASQTNLTTATAAANSNAGAANVGNPNKLLPTSDSASPMLRGLAESGSFNTSVTPISNCPIMHYRGNKLSCFVVHLKNTSDHTLIIDGDNAKGDIGAQTISATSAATILQASSSNLSGRQKILGALLTVGTIGLGGIIIGEKLTDDQHNKRDPMNSIGLDGVRHGVEQARFGRRMVLPGDETEGWIAFETSDSAAVKAVKIPICFSPMRTSPTFLTVPVSQTPSPHQPTTQPTSL